MLAILLRTRSRFTKVLYFVACLAPSVTMFLHVLSQAAKPFAVPHLLPLDVSMLSSLVHCSLYFVWLSFSL